MPKEKKWPLYIWYVLNVIVHQFQTTSWRWYIITKRVRWNQLKYNDFNILIFLFANFPWCFLLFSFTAIHSLRIHLLLSTLIETKRQPLVRIASICFVLFRSTKNSTSYLEKLLSLRVIGYYEWKCSCIYLSR